MVSVLGLVGCRIQDVRLMSNEAAIVDSSSMSPTFKPRAAGHGLGDKAHVRSCERKSEGDW